ncbi:YadA-like family protein [Megasphaera elsdenii]|uniref:YadA C-terminal domain-containing protein n=1 Tax=Megasphaera elsdenii TaxID=907 RepID=UPI001D007F3D|nr:YadA C-terminal domain-containing protein [Megasphaera elsdenii]MCB5703169.1 YadA-like family protein [Megasphaera elsdenii]MCB5727371.1 YadA-like family protein [Megasphaera elsdenii]MCB5771151.1 YadA-like family protein [Megasphaera elsdenii]
MKNLKSQSGTTGTQTGTSSSAPAKAAGMQTVSLASLSKMAVSPSSLFVSLAATGTGTPEPVVYDNDGQTISLENTDGNGTKIQNVADGFLGAGSQDAINGRQLYATNLRITDIADALSKNNSTIAQAQTDITRVKTQNITFKSDINTLKTQVNTGWNATINGAKLKTVNPSNNMLNFTNGDDIVLTDAGNGSLKVAVKASGKVEAGDAHVVTGDAVYQAIKDMPTGEGLVKYDEGTQTITVAADKGATKVDFSGKDSDGNTINRTITGIVTDAKDATSAANVGYVQDVAGSLANGVQRVANQLSHDINKVGAGAAALAGLHPGEFDPDNKLDFAAGYGHYKGANAGALGAYYHPNEDTIISLAGTMGNGDPMLSAGVTFKLGPSGPNTLSRTALTKTLASVQKQNQVLTAQNQAIAQQMAAVDQKNQQLEKDMADLKEKLAALMAAKA